MPDTITDPVMDATRVLAELGSVDVEAMTDDDVTFGAGYAIAEDRMGVRGSIIGRVERHGGTATIRSRPGEGTEVALSVPVRGGDTSQADSPSARVPTEEVSP